MILTHKPILLTTIFLIWFSLGISAQSKTETEIFSIIQKQAEYWNNGNIAGFMDYYWNSEKLKFVSKNGVSYGWQKVYDNYKKAYPSKEKMGQLTFTLESIQKINNKNAIAIGKWELKREKDEDLSGYFSLIWKKIKGKWLIVIDHTS